MSSPQTSCATRPAGERAVVSRRVQRGDDDRCDRHAEIGGAFTRRWTLGARPRIHCSGSRSPGCCASRQGRGAGAHQADADAAGTPCGARCRPLVSAVGAVVVRKRRGRYATPEASRAEISVRLRRAAERLGPTYIKLGQIISSGEGLFPAELVERVQAVPRPGARRAVRRRPHGGRGRSRGSAGDRVRVVRPHTARRRIDRTGARGHAAHRRARRGEGAAAQRRPARAQGPARHGVAGAAPRRPHSDRLAGQPAGAGRAVRRDDRRGARLPHGSRQHDRHRRHAARAGADRVRGPPPAPVAGHAACAGDAADRRVQLRRRGRHEGRRHRHRGGRAHGDGRADGGRDGLRRVPRRPARRQPVRAAGRAHRAARLRHRRPARPAIDGWRSCG